MENEGRCENCKFVKVSNTWNDKSEYYCRFNAPLAGYKVSHVAHADDENSPNKYGMNEWPFDRVTFNLGVKVERNYWCGMFKMEDKDGE